MTVAKGRSRTLVVWWLHVFCFCSLNPVIDIGQVEGAFVMGIGYWLMEKLVFDKDSGQLLTHNTWVKVVMTWILFYDIYSTFLQEYKPPSSKDIPIDFRVELLKDTPNPIGVLGSKGKQEKHSQSDIWIHFSIFLLFCQLLENHPSAWVLQFYLLLRELWRVQELMLGTQNSLLYVSYIV